MATERPPLDLQVELVYPDGTTARWDRDSPAKDTPTGISSRTKRYTGFADAGLALARRGDVDYPDLGLLDGINLIGHDGAVAFEGTNASNPRSLQTAWSIGVQAVGWMGHAKDEQFVEPYIDRDLSKWVSAPARWVAQVLGENFNYGSSSQVPDEAGNPGMDLSFPGAWVAPYKPLADAWWLSHAGIQIGALFYNFAAHNAATMSAADLNWAVRAYLAATDNAISDVTANLWPTHTSGYLSAGGPRAFAGIQLWYGSTPGGGAGAPYYARFQQLAVYGTHGLTRRGPDPGGFYVSDIMANIAQRWAPKLDTSGIQPTTFVVPHASFLDDTYPYDAFQTLNAYHRWEMDVYEDRRLNYYPIKLDDWDWEIRASDPGTTVLLQGDDAANLCNGVNVRYRDLDTGYETRLTPGEYPELRDLSPDNPANLAGRHLYPTLRLSVPTTKEGALQMGRAYLSEFNQAQAPGSITVGGGYVRDRAGHWQQGWKVRASDRLLITDMPNDSVRIVGETDWQHDAKRLTIAVDTSFKRLDAILARLGVAVEASGLALP